MIYKCNDCEKTFAENEMNVKVWTESRGEFWGMPCSEEMTECTCPHCGSEDFEEYKPKKEYEIKVTVVADDFDPSYMMKGMFDYINEEWEVDSVEVKLESKCDMEEE